MQSKLRSLVPRSCMVATASLLIIGCVPDDDYDRVVKEKANLMFEIEDLEAKLEAATERMEMDADLNSRETSGLKIQLEENAAEHEAVRLRLAAELETLLQEFEAYKQEFKIQAREAAVGQDLGDLMTLSGKTFFGASIKEVNPAGITVAHVSGVAFVDYSDVPAALARQLGFSKSEAVAFMEAIEEAERKFRQSQIPLSAPEAAQLRRKIGIWGVQVSRLENDLAKKRRDSAPASEIRALEKRIKQLTADISEAKRQLPGFR